MSKRKKVLLIVFSGIMAHILSIGFCFFIFFIPEIFHFDRYRGEYPHLYTVAINSLLTEGRISWFEGYSAAEIYKLEEDEYGRELFIYSGSPIAFSIDFMGAHTLMVCQKHDKNYAYWYEYDCFILAPNYENGADDEDLYMGITDEQIEELKEKNDWGKEIDESRMSCAKIVRDSSYINGDRKKAEKFYEGLFPENDYDYRWSYNIARDKDGRSLYCINGRSWEDEPVIIAITYPDGEFYEEGWFIFESPTNYAEDLQRIKENTGWNMK